VQPMTGITPFVRYGNLPVGVLAALLLAVGLWCRIRRTGDPVSR